MPTKNVKRKGGIAAIAFRTAALGVLLVGLLLSAVNLSFMIDKSGSLAGLTESWEQMRENYRARRSAPLRKAPAPEPAETAAPGPTVLYSVVKFREGERQRIDDLLVTPLLAHYAAQAGAADPTRSEGPALDALLIERKNASSKDVNVRLFFADGTEIAYLWPLTHATDGVWTVEP